MMNVNVNATMQGQLVVFTVLNGCDTMKNHLNVKEYVFEIEELPLEVWKQCKVNTASSTGTDYCGKCPTKDNNKAKLYLANEEWVDTKRKRGANRRFNVRIYYHCCGRTLRIVFPLAKPKHGFNEWDMHCDLWKSLIENKEPFNSQIFV